VQVEQTDCLAERRRATIAVVATELYQFIELWMGLRDGEAYDGWGPELDLP
jgi:hypothetical protein